MAFGGEVVLVHNLNRIPVPPGDRMPVRTPHGQHAGHREFGSGGYGAHFLLAAARGVDSVPWMPGLAKARVINPPLTPGILPTLLCVTKSHHYRMRHM
jgi:hypothetical protein